MKSAICILGAAVGLFLSGISPNAAQEMKPAAALSLQDCINIALKNQNDVILARNNVTIARANSTQAKSAYFPQLSIQNNAFVTGSDGVLTEQRTGTALTVTQNIFDGGLREAQVKGARYGVTESRAGLTRVVQVVVFDVTQTYYDTLRAERLADVARANVNYNEGLYELIQARVNAGDAAQVDILPVESQLANARVNLVAAENDFRTAKVQLQNTMGLSPQTEFAIQDVGPLPEMKIDPLDSYLAGALNNRPDIQESKAGVGIAKSSVKAARISLYPRPAIAGRYERGVGGLSGTSSQIIGGFTFDLFNGGRNQAVYKEAKALEANALQRASQVNKDIEAQVQQAYLNLTSAGERVAASEIGLQAAQKNYDAQNAKYKQGLAIPLDLLNAEVQLVTAQTVAVNARYDHYAAIAQLDFAVGKYGGFNGKE
ncbi:MAG: TolC family protein [Armatimonadota bacterium]|nr:TolC family protein [Armatimonadota bacterium]